MKKQAKICFCIFLLCTFCVLGIVGYLIFRQKSKEVMLAPRFFTFAEIEDADSYNIRASKNKQDSNYLMVNCKVNKSELADESGYSFNNVVTNNENGKILVEETYTLTITDKDDKKSKIDCLISDYEVTIYNNAGTKEVSYSCPEKELEEVDTNSIYCLISEYFGSLFNEDGTYYIVVVALDETGQVIESSATDELEFEYMACYENEFNKREKFFMNGEWCDYIITNKRELELLVWHAILYRENNVTFYVKTKDITSSNINDLVKSYINSYPEYDGLCGNLKNEFAIMKNPVGTLVNFVFYLDEDHDKTADKELEIKYPEIRDIALAQKKHKDKSFEVDYVKSAVSEGKERELKIDDEGLDEVPVYNTEQLFMVVQYGAKPLFESDCIASEVYNNARNIALTINNSNNLTDYEKALNIYTYICENVVYDYVSLAYMEELDDYKVSTFGNLSCFYLEGALYKPEEGQFAVCDGLSKTYCLLARIEGIECVKVNGKVTGGNHAWNKIKLTDSSLGLNGWYGIDTTWGMAVSGNEEILTHNYFLSTGGSRTVTFCPNSYWSQDADYYRITTYNYNNAVSDFYIENNRELADIFNYAQYELLNSNKENFVIEFKLGYFYYKNIPKLGYRKVNSLLSSEDEYNKYFGWMQNRGVNLLTNEFAYDAYFIDNIIVISVSKVPAI